MTLNSFRPAGPFSLSVADRSQETWIAISNPVEMGFYSWLAKKLAKSGLEVLIVGLVLIAFGSWLDLRGCFSSLFRFSLSRSKVA
jgi:hypothetical protein